MHILSKCAYWKNDFIAGYTPGMEEESLVRFSVLLTEAEQQAFDQLCRYGGRHRLSMSSVARELCRLAVAGKVAIDRERLHAESRRGGKGHRAPPARKPKKKG